MRLKEIRRPLVVRKERKWQEMKSKTGGLILSGLMLAALVLASCGPAAPAVEKPAVEKPAVEKPAVEKPGVEKPTAPEEKAEMVKVTLTKRDGTAVVTEVEVPSYGGTFTMLHTNSPTRFDPHFRTGHPSHAYLHHLTNEYLTIGNFTKGPAGTNETSWRFMWYPDEYFMEGGVAESWERPDDTTIIWHIRKGIHWQVNPKVEASDLVGGRELTADDVVASFHRAALDPEGYCYHGYPETVKSVTAPDKWTVVTKTFPGKQGDAWEIQYGFGHAICAREVIEHYPDLNTWQRQLGTGAFMLTDYVAGASSTLTRNPDYWRKDPFFPENQLPYVDEVKWLVVPDYSTQLAALRTGKADAVREVTWEDALSLERTNPELKSVDYPANAQTLFWRLDNLEFPWADQRVRRALWLAVDNKEIDETFYGGTASWYPNYPLFPSNEYGDMIVPFEELPESTRELYEYHPDKAKELLAQAGYPDGFKMKVVMRSTDVDLWSIVQNYWEQVNVEMEMDVKEQGVYTSQLWGHTYEQAVAGNAMGQAPFRYCNMQPWHAVCYARLGQGGIEDSYWVEEVYQPMAANYFNESVRRQMFREDIPRLLDKAYWLSLPARAFYVFWQPWVRNYQGERDVGFQLVNNYPIWVWIDQEMKESMGR